jgi:hypothetical protein
MTANQLFFALAALIVALAGFFKYYLDAKIAYLDAKLDPISRQVDSLIHYMVNHEGKIARLEEKAKD